MQKDFINDLSLQPINTFESPTDPEASICTSMNLYIIIMLVLKKMIFSLFLS